jgi:NAD dependent epimerase/dehydratase family enzyme
VPDFALSTLLGEGASVVLEGQKVLPSRTQQQGFR